MSALELIVPSVELLEEEFGDGLAELDLAAIGILQASEFETQGTLSARELFDQVETRVADMRDALDRMEVTLDLLRRHEPYRS